MLGPVCVLTCLAGLGHGERRGGGAPDQATRFLWQRHRHRRLAGPDGAARALRW